MNARTRALACLRSNARNVARPRRHLATPVTAVWPRSGRRHRRTRARAALAPECPLAIDAGHLGQRTAERVGVLVEGAPATKRAQRHRFHPPPCALAERLRAELVERRAQLAIACQQSADRQRVRRALVVSQRVELCDDEISNALLQRRRDRRPRAGLERRKRDEAPVRRGLLLERYGRDHALDASDEPPEPLFELDERGLDPAHDRLDDVATPPLRRAERFWGCRPVGAWFGATADRESQHGGPDIPPRQQKRRRQRERAVVVTAGNCLSP